MKPKLIKYFDTSEEKDVIAYLIRKDENYLYFCSPTAFKIVQDANLEGDLQEVSARRLPISWCRYQDLYHTNNSNAFSEIIKKNYNKILEFVKENKQEVVRISEFLEEFTDYRCEKDFITTCVIAKVITAKYVSLQTMQQLFNLIFDHYYEIVEENKFPLLINRDIGPFFTRYSHNQELFATC